MRGEQLATGVEELDHVRLAEGEVAHEEGIAFVHLVLYRQTVRTNQADPGDLVPMDSTSSAKESLIPPTT